MLTEAQVQKSFIGLVNKAERTDDDFDKAEELLDQLRPESPLRHRLHVELEELRHLSSAE